MKSCLWVRMLMVLITLPAMNSAVWANTSVGGEIVGIGGKCLSVAGNGTSDGTRVQISTCNGATAEQWLSVDGEIRFRGMRGKCLDVQKASTQDGTPVEIWSCNGGQNQQWFLNNSKILGIGKQCLDVQKASTQDGTPVEIWSCNGGRNQQWHWHRTFWNPPPWGQ
jgi:Ricin-type beta-trefoil lectin domain